MSITSPVGAGAGTIITNTATTALVAFPITFATTTVTQTESSDAETTYPTFMTTATTAQTTVNSTFVSACETTESLCVLQSGKTIILTNTTANATATTLSLFYYIPLLSGPETLLISFYAPTNTSAITTPLISDQCDPTANATVATRLPYSVQFEQPALMNASDAGVQVSIQSEALNAWVAARQRKEKVGVFVGVSSINFQQCVVGPAGDPLVFLVFKNASTTTKTASPTKTVQPITTLSPSPIPTTSELSPTTTSSLSTGAIAGIAVAALSLCIVMASIFIYKNKKYDSFLRGRKLRPVSTASSGTIPRLPQAAGFLVSPHQQPLPQSLHDNHPPLPPPDYNTCTATAKSDEIIPTPGNTVTTTGDSTVITVHHQTKTVTVATMIGSPDAIEIA
ncbi:hypothetical protein HK100_003427, partial [Physocladia obscura]